MAGAFLDRFDMEWPKYANDSADRLDTIEDHRLFLVALIVFSQSVGSNWDARALHSGTISFYPIDEVQNGVHDTKYPIISGTRMLSLKNEQGLT